MELGNITVGKASFSDSSYLSTIHYCVNEGGKKEFVLKKSRKPIQTKTIELMKKIFQFSHPNLLLPIDWEIQNGISIELYEKIEWPRLDKFSYEVDKNWNLGHAMKIIYQLTDVLSLFHNNGIIHHDVRDSNIFINKDTLELKIFDYNYIASPYFLEKGVDTWNPVPPEYRKGLCVIDFQFDVYQVGYLFQRMTHRYTSHLKTKEPMFEIPKKIIKIMNRALAENRKERYNNCSEFYLELNNF